MLVIIHIDSVASIGVSAGKFVDIASELVVADDFIKGVAIRVRILWMQPVAVLVDDGVTANLIHVGIQLGYGADELIARHLHVLGTINAKQLRQIIDDEVEAFLSVGTHEDVGLLEGCRGERTLGRLVEERAVNHRHERELAYSEGAPLVLHQFLRILRQQAVDRLTQIVAIMRATHCFGQPDATHDRFVARDYRPWRGR